MLLLLSISWSESILSASICLVKHSKTLFQLKGGLGFASFPWQVCQQQWWRGRDTNSGMPGLFYPKRPPGKYEKAVRLGKEKSNGKPCATPVFFHHLFLEGQKCLPDRALGGGWIVFTYCTRVRGHKCRSFFCSMQPWNDGVPASLLGYTASF